MKSSNRIITVLFAILIASSVFGQNYKEIAYDYMRVEEELGNNVKFSKADVHKFSNGNVLVDLYVTQNYTSREEFTVPNGGVINYMDGNGQIKSTNKAYKDHKESVTWSYKVFISKSGKPLKYISPKGGYEIKYLPNSVWVFEHGRSKKVGENWLSNYDNIKCYSSEGTLLEEKNNLVLFSIAETQNYMYLVGEINTPNGSRSIVRIINRITNVSKDKLGELGEIDYSLQFTNEGVSIAKQKNNEKPIRYILPYESGDENFQKQSVMEGHSVDDDKVYDVSEDMPKFDGDVVSWLAENMKYPIIAEENGIQGRVIMSFIVERDGSLSNIVVRKSVDPSLDKEAIRVINAMPKWKPGCINGLPVRVNYTLPVAFKLGR